MGKSGSEGNGGERRIEGVATSVTAFVGVTETGLVDEPVEVASFDAFIAVFGGLQELNPLSQAVRLFFENGGERAVIVRVGSADGVVPAEGVESGRGLYALEKQDLFNLLVIPSVGWDRDVAAVTWAAAGRYCLSRRAFLLVDAPATGTASTVEEGKWGLATLTGQLRPDSREAANAAYYFPRVVAPSGSNTVAPAGAIAGVFARTDRSIGVWKAPAGSQAELRGVTGLAIPVSQRDNEQLHPMGVNCLRQFGDQAPVVWGARTLQGADELSSEWKYVPVRRLALFIEESIDRGTQWAGFEPNDEPLWAMVRYTVGDFLHDLYQRGAFQGRTPGDAFFVKCDRSTMTQDDIDAGRVNIVIGFAPARPAEFVILRITRFLEDGEQMRGAPYPGLSPVREGNECSPLPHERGAGGEG